jgi:hypothetical protein
MSREIFDLPPYSEIWKDTKKRTPLSKERELLREIMGYIASGVVSITSNDLGDAAETLHEIQELLAQPEQEPLLIETKIEWYGKGFRQGVNEFAPPKPLTEDVIYALDDEGIVENMSVHQVRYVLRWIRRVEKAHGIGGGE